MDKSLTLRARYMTVTITNRGKTPRGLRKAFNAASKEAWRQTAVYFHENLRDQRFTPEHAEAAGYTKRKGQLQPPGSKSFRSSYYGRKYRSERGGGEGKANPLQNTGETRRAVATQYRISSTSKGGRVFYSGARVFNFRQPTSRVRMNDEFAHLLETERVQLGRIYDVALDRLLNATE